MSSTSFPVTFAGRVSVGRVVSPNAHGNIGLTDEPFASTRLPITALEEALAAAADSVVAEGATQLRPCRMARLRLMDTP